MQWWGGGGIYYLVCSVSYPTTLPIPTHQPIQPQTGIGRDAALYLADEGGFLVLAGVRRAQDGEALKAKAAHPERIVPVILDVTKPVRPSRPPFTPGPLRSYSPSLTVCIYTYIHMRTGSHHIGAGHRPVGAGGAAAAIGTCVWMGGGYGLVWWGPLDHSALNLTCLFPQQTPPRVPNLESPGGPRQQRGCDGQGRPGAWLIGIYIYISDATYYS